MLKQLTIHNFAIIENIDIHFDAGLTILLGETGAGKSLIIDSLSLLLGERASTELIRNGEEKATIKGVFSINNIHLNSLLNKLGIVALDEQVTVERIISPNKSLVKVNGVTVTLGDLKEISKYLADIHMQFDNQRILNPENFLEIIDGFKFELTNEYRNKYSQALERFNDAKGHYLSLVKRQEEINERRDIYQYELDELTKADLKENEEEEIKEEISLLTHYDKIFSLLEEADSLVRSDFLDKLYELTNIYDKLSEYQKNYDITKGKLNDHYYELEDLFSDIKKEHSKLDYDPNRLNTLQERLHLLESLKKKYKKSVAELIEHQKELHALLMNEEDFNVALETAKKDMQNAYISAFNAGMDLSNIRREIAKSIKKELEKNMLDLSLQAKFEVSFNNVNKEEDYKGNIFKVDGIDEVDFLIETNIGEGLKPLAKIVSGGEASRIMLALKALFIKSQKISTVIFDEIDTGISGEVARKVAMKIYEISLTTQVIAITHLPQVAAYGVHHLKISKTVNKGRTFTEIKELSLEEKTYEIASLISGGKVTEKQLEYAKELILNK